MKTAREVSPEKLRGGFYTPAPLVDFCLARLASLTADDRTLRLLEPSAGDGAFVSGLLDRWPRDQAVTEITAIELVETEAARCRKLLPKDRGRVVAASFLPWALESAQQFDAAVGNPPFVRFQFVSPEDRRHAEVLAERLGVSIKGVANLWIPVLFAAISCLRRGGAFTFVVPTECITGAAAGRMREWLLREVSSLRLDLFPPKSFPSVLQEVAVLSGIAATPAQSTLTISQHASTASPRTWTVEPAVDRGSWTPYLLESIQRAALAEISARPSVHRLSDLASFEVSIVTGANDFFSVDEATLEDWQLGDWREPLLSRIRYAPGLLLNAREHAKLASSGIPAWILNFSPNRGDPVDEVIPSSYIEAGEARGLHRRFKCRIRDPWYRVPNFQRGDLLLSKRSHRFPRVVVNEAGVFTTDTIYRGRVLSGAPKPRALAACFHNSLTAVTAELEGRSFGGGVLELVPSEVSRLLVPRCDEAGAWIDELDQISRTTGSDELIEATDAALIKGGVLGREDVEVLSSARAALLDRRLARNRHGRPLGEQQRLAA